MGAEQSSERQQGGGGRSGLETANFDFRQCGGSPGRRGGAGGAAGGGVGGRGWVGQNNNNWLESEDRAGCYWLEQGQDAVKRLQGEQERRRS